MANWCCNFLTVEGSKVNLDKFMDESIVKGNLCYEVEGEIVEIEPIIDFDSNNKPRYKVIYNGEDKFGIAFESRWRPYTESQSKIADKYKDLIFTNFYDEPSERFCGFDISIDGTTTNQLNAENKEYKILKKICEKKGDSGYKAFLEILKEFILKRDAKKYNL